MGAEALRWWRTFWVVSGLALVGLAPGMAQESRSDVEAGLAALRALDGAAALDHFLEAAGAGDSGGAQFAGELLYVGGLGAVRDPQRACDLFQQAAEGGRGDGAHSYATCFYNGQGRGRDLASAAQWYSEAMSLGFVRSQCALGNMYVRGEGVPRDVAQGLALCRGAAEAGDAGAQADLGTYYLFGEVVRRDFDLAERWLRAAAEQDHPDAAFLLASMIWRGDAGSGEKTASIPWWRVALLGGRVDAAWRLGDALLVKMMDGATSVDDVLAADFRAARAAYDIAAAQDPDPEARAYALQQLRLLDTLVVTLDAELSRQP